MPSVGQAVIFGIAGIPSTSYANTGGTGDRGAIITASTTVTLDSGTAGALINGDTGTNGLDTDGGAVAALYFRFQFASRKCITEAKLYGSSTFTETGTWIWQGSNDGSSWENIGSNHQPDFSVAGAADTQLSTNVNFYLYYQLLGVSGSSNGGTFWREFEFKISA